MKSHLSDEMTQNSKSLSGIMRSGNAENDESGDWTNPRPGNNFVKKSEIIEVKEIFFFLKKYFKI